METDSKHEKEAWLRDKHENGSRERPPARARSSGRSTLEKILLLTVVLLLLALIAVAVALAVILSKNTGGTESEGSQTCLSKECISAAARLDRYIDYNERPCDNFYQFACGRWMQENVIPDDKSGFNTFDDLQDQVDIVLRNLVQSETTSTELGSVKKVKELYASCMNYDLINSRGDQPLKELLLREFGGWPLTYRSWSESGFDLTHTLVKLNTYNKSPIILFYVGVDNKNSSRNVFKMDQTSFGMPGQKYYQVPRNDTMLMSYQELIYQVGELMGFADPVKARSDVSDIVDFEIRLANISVPDEDRRDNNALYNPMTLAQVQGNYSTILNWRDYVLTLATMPAIGVKDVTDDEIIINMSPAYYRRLADLLQATPKRIQANYLIWRFVGSLIANLGEKYKGLLITYRKTLFGTSSESPRFRTCIRLVNSALGLTVGRMFIKDNFDASSKTIALNMIKGIQKSFNYLLDELDWMDEDTKRVAREKNDFITPKIGYPDELMNDTYLEEYYTNFTYHRDQYFENIIVQMRESFNHNIRQLRQIVHKNRWDSPPPTVNAFYSPMKNQITFPAGILQPPFFSKSFPKSLNYGGIGVVMGHEITHGFDDRGRQYDRHGNLAQWWSSSAVENFKNSAKCIVNQYGNFTVPEGNLKVNGITTLGENIADNGGIKQAFRAYRDWVTEQGKEEPRLPGLEFNNDQLFFINFAQLWCSLMTKEEALNRIKTRAHSPSRFRVIGSLQNSPDFAKSFNCQPNSLMNPTNKCSVW